VRGHRDPAGPTIGELADYLVLRHHSVVELVDRAVAAGLARRRRDGDENRVVRLRLTADGERAIEDLTLLHLEEIRRLAPALRELGDGNGGGETEAPRR
jgi:DNA-binding MarR family transcriptional regulator